MKIILSRKGFDSGYGGYPSPILPNGQLISFPIPTNSRKRKYSELQYNNDTNYQDIITNLIGNSIKFPDGQKQLLSDIGCHLDPDIRYSSMARDDMWTGLFGQAGAAQSHLENKGISKNDIFLFFGWFRKTEFINGKLQYDKKDKMGSHIIFGYLEVDEIKKINKYSFPKWMHTHPHIIRGKTASDNDSIYISTRKLSLSSEKKGYGTFKYHPSLKLTKNGMSKSKWNLPQFFKNTEMSYHKSTSWKKDYFQSVAKGQEFVINVTPEIDLWLRKILNNKTL